MKEIMKVMKVKYYIGILSWFLLHENWHTKEETLKALIISAIETNDPNNSEIDYLTLVEGLGYCLVDWVPKVRYVAMETAAIFCKYTAKQWILELLYEMINKANYLAICDWLDHGMLPYLSDGGWIEFPYLFSDDFKQSLHTRTEMSWFMKIHDWIVKSSQGGQKKSGLLTPNPSLPSIHKKDSE